MPPRREQPSRPEEVLVAKDGHLTGSRRYAVPREVIRQADRLHDEGDLDAAHKLLDSLRRGGASIVRSTQTDAKQGRLSL